MHMAAARRDCMRASSVRVGEQHKFGKLMTAGCARAPAIEMRERKEFHALAVAAGVVNFQVAGGVQRGTISARENLI